jgi:hypothetical protein
MKEREAAALVDIICGALGSVMKEKFGAMQEQIDTLHAQVMQLQIEKAALAKRLPAAAAPIPFPKAQGSLPRRQVEDGKRI